MCVRGGGWGKGEGPRVEMIAVSTWMVLNVTLRGKGTGVGGGCM